MTSSRIFRFSERAAVLVLTVLLVLVLTMQARLLYIFPQPDSARWWGDETGQMLELRTELQDGVASIPTGLGSSVAITNGLVRGNSWLAAFVYGVPALIFSNVTDVVTIGRTVTFILSLILLFGMFAFMRTLHVPRFLALFALLLFVTTRSFFFGSHAARLDIAAGLAVLLLTWYLSVRYDRIKEMRWAPSPRWYFVCGVIVVLLATLSIHLVTLVGMLTLYMLWRFRAYSNPAAMFALSGGVIAMVAVLLSIYALSGAQVSLFGPSNGSNQFQSVAGGLPILRPFSRSVQVANILERLHGLISEAPAFLLLIVFALLLRLASRRNHPVSPRERWTSGAAMVVAIAWLLLQSPALYYYVQVLPLFIVALTIVIGSRQFNPTSAIAFIIVGLAFSSFAIRDTVRAGELSRALAKDDNAALREAMQAIKQDSQAAARPIVLAQNPAIAWMEHRKDVQLMTAHVLSFPTSNASIPQILNKIGVNYVLLYATRDATIYSAEYRALRPIADSEGTALLRRPGTLFDVHRDYFQPMNPIDTASQDTLILYKLPPFAR